MPTCGKFDTMKDFINLHASSVVTLVENKNPPQQQRPQPYTQHVDRSWKDGLQGYHPHISMQADITSGISGKSGLNKHSRFDGEVQSSA